MFWNKENISRNYLFYYLLYLNTKIEIMSKITFIIWDLMLWWDQTRENPFRFEERPRLADNSFANSLANKISFFLFL